VLTPVVYDVNVLVNALVGPDSSYPYLPRIPPTTENAAADCLAIALDGDDMLLFSSLHILSTTATVLVRLGVGADLAQRYVDELTDIITELGGAVLDPPRKAHDSRDHEDNLVLDCALAAEALIVVSSDHDLTSLNPWNGRLILTPERFVTHVVAGRRGSSSRG
jgi:predicted nucleic acid-binding protein